MKTILMLLAAVTIPFASAATSANSMPTKSMAMTKGMTNTNCMKKGGMVKMVKGQKMCMMKPMMAKPSTMKK